MLNPRQWVVCVRGRIINGPVGGVPSFTPTENGRKNMHIGRCDLINGMKDKGVVPSNQGEKEGSIGGNEQHLSDYIARGGMGQPMQKNIGGVSNR